MTQPLPLDTIFSALSDPTRRQFMTELRAGPLSISELASGVSISLPAVSRHIKVLESAGLIHRHKQGRTTFIRLAPESLDDAASFLDRTRKGWNSTLDALEAYLDTQEPPGE